MARLKGDFLRLGTGFLSITSSLSLALKNHNEPEVLLACIFFIIACTFDCLWSKIPNLLNASLALAGLALFFYTDSWNGLLTGMLGMSLGVALLLVPWLMGGMGAGDVKALGALGALLGPLQLIQVFIYMGLIGGVMAILHYTCERNLRKKLFEWFQTFKASTLTRDPRILIPEEKEVSRFPYAAAIAFGYYSFQVFGGIF